MAFLVNTDLTKKSYLKYENWLSQVTHIFVSFFQSFLRGETQIPKDEAFKECIESYLHVFLKSERVSQIVGGGALSQHDCREVFRYYYIFDHE